MGTAAVDVPPQNNRMHSLISRQITLEVMRFDRTPASEFFGIEIQHHPIAAIVVETAWLAFLGIRVNGGAMLPASEPDDADNITDVAITRRTMATTNERQIISKSFQISASSP